MGETARKYSAKGPAIIAVFVALLIAVQYALSFVPGVELVTVTFTAFCCAFGAKRGMAAATSFSLLRQLIFGFYPTVLVLYLVYYNALALTLGLLARKQTLRLHVAVLAAVIGTICFTLFDNILTPLWYQYSAEATLMYFKASIPFALIQSVCAGVSTAVLFDPVKKIFSRFAY